MEPIENRKVLGVECWCPKFETSIRSGINSVLVHGNAVALIGSANTALERRDCTIAEELLDCYIRKVPQAERDSEWIGATRRTIARLRAELPSRSDATPETGAVPPFRLETLDQRILAHKRNELAIEMNRRVAEATRRIRFESAQKHNVGAYWPELIVFYEKLLDERAQRLYEAYCETWVLQGRTMTPDFIRAVRDRPIAQLFSVSKSSVIGEMGRYHRSTGGLWNNSGSAKRWTLSVDRLATRWREKLEAEAAAAEYSPNRSSSRSPIPEMRKYQSIPTTWDEFFQAFKALSDEEVEDALKNQRDRLLRAYVDYHDPTLKYGDFQFGGGISETFKARFVVLAISSARKLSAHRLDGPPLNLWLFQLFQDLIQNKSDLLFAPSETGAIITRVCEASALYCLRLQAKTLEEDQPLTKDAPSTVAQVFIPGRLPRRLERGKDCEELTEEIRTIRYKRVRSGMTIDEIQKECASFKVWKRVEVLSAEDRDTFVRPGTWETGYENLLLGKIYATSQRAVAPGTVETWRKEYRAYLKWQEKHSDRPADEFIRQLADRKRSYRKKSAQA